ncbi:MAG: caspase family protein [Sphingomonadales bacterium]|jgi:hypothetical protein
MARLYALLVGINNYDVVPRLSGCIADMQRMEAWLRDTWPAADLAIETLTDEDATRPNVMAQFRAHLGQAGAGDVALFHYCGHGARARSAPEFAEFFTGGKDEGLVCIDSRRPGGFDLADKELAVLIEEVAARDPHLAIVLDCCNSGSGTRDADLFRDFVPRTVAEQTAGRSLDSYADGYYAAQLKRGETLHIPEGKHVLMAACDRMQTAKELTGHGGVFTTGLIEALRACPPDVSYPELFMRTRAAARAIVDGQDPQFETIGGFDAYSAFLGRGGRSARRLYEVSRSGDGWLVKGGALHGLPTDASAPVSFALFASPDYDHPIASATARTVGAQSCDIDVTPALPATVTDVRAALTSLPVPPMLVGFDGDPAIRDQVAAALQPGDAGAGSVPSAEPVALADLPLAAAHRLVEGGDLLTLVAQGTGTPIQSVRIGPAGTPWFAPMLDVLRHVAQWERSWRLANGRPQLDPASVSMWYDESRPDGSSVRHDGDMATLRIVDGKVIRGTLKAANHSGQDLNVALFYYSQQYGILSLPGPGVIADGGELTLWGDNPATDYFLLGPDDQSSIERFKLVFSTEPLDDFLMTLDPLAMGATIAAMRAIGNVQPLKRPVTNDWLTRDMSFTLVKGLASVGADAVSLANGSMQIAANPAVQATLSLATSTADTREGGDSAMARGLARQGLQPVDVSAGGSTGGGTVLDIGNISQPGQLAAAPIAISVNTPVAAGETLLGVAFDGPVPMLFPASAGDDGRQHLAVDAAPTQSDSRDVVTSLKLFLFKAVLRRDDVNLLRKVTVAADGSVALDGSGLATAVAAARSILVLLPGLLGDATALAQGVAAAGFAGHHDLVLGYDYENLNTPIEDTARALKAQLAAAGLDLAGPAKLTLLGHGIGGLVARWLVEQEGGAGAVAHMILCGTPNLGSPLGNVDTARKLIATIVGAAPKFLPLVAPYVGPLLVGIDQSKKLSATLEQLKPGSPLLDTLAKSADPGVRTTLLAGDVSAYQEPGDGDWYQDMLLRAARGLPFDLLFAGQKHDVLTAVNSAFGLPPRTPAPVRTDVACHYLNMFTAPAGQAALAGIAPA